MRALMASDRMNDPKVVIEKKHKEYYRKGKTYQYMYYATRIVAGVSAAAVPFVVSSQPTIARVLSVVVVVVTVIDTIFSPREKSKALSKATDLLYVQGLKREGKYDEFKAELDTILSTEDKLLLDVVAMEDVANKVKKLQENHKTPAKEKAKNKKGK